MARIAVLILALLVAACTPRAQIAIDPRAADIGATVPVFVATTRAGSGPFDFGPERSQIPAFSRLDISVPPQREPGTLAWPAGADIDPARQFLAAETATYPDGASFRADLRRALSRRGARGNEVIIYVHGFNNTFAEGVLRISQLAHDLSLPGVAVHYAWPSAGNPLGYIYDRDSALFARDGLEALIREVEAAGADQIVVVAHSLGSLVTMEALRQMAIDRPGSVYRRIDGVILISPDIDIDVFRAQAARIGRLPDPFGIFVSKRDRALALISRLAGQQNRLGNVANVDQVSDLEVTIIDVTGFSQGLGHFTPGTSPVLLQIFARAASVDTAFRGDASGRIGLLPGTVLTVQNATEIILTPVTGLARAVAQ